MQRPHLLIVRFGSQPEFSFTLSKITPSIRYFLFFPLLYLQHPARSNSQCYSFMNMAKSTSAVVGPATVTASVVNYGSKARQRTPKVVYIGGMSSYEGLKAHNNVIYPGLPVSTEKCFANIVSSLKASGKGRTGGGCGALSSTCNAAAEIFKIAAIMNGLVLVGVAVGFVLLRIEASLEESEE